MLTSKDGDVKGCLSREGQGTGGQPHEVLEDRSRQTTVLYPEKSLSVFSGGG